jgi:hypothetical protein
MVSRHPIRLNTTILNSSFRPVAAGEVSTNWSDKWSHTSLGPVIVLFARNTNNGRHNRVLASKVLLRRKTDRHMWCDPDAVILRCTVLVKL